MSERRTFRSVWLVLLACLCLLMPAAAASKLTLSAGVLAPYTTPDRKGFLDQLMAAVFREIGMEAELLIYPTATERGMLNANEGLDDGLAMRIAGLEKQYPNLIRVPEEVAVNDFVAITTGRRFATSGWESLQPYVVSYIMGWKVFEAHIPKGKEPPLVRTRMYMYLYKKHAALVRQVAAALVKLKKNGTYQRLYGATLKPLAAPEASSFLMAHPAVPASP